MSMQAFPYIVFGVYFPAEEIDYFEFTEQDLPQGLEWFPVGDQSSEKLGTILGLQESHTDLSDFVGHMYPSGVKHDWHLKLHECLSDLNIETNSIVPTATGARWHIAGWVG